MGNPDEMTSTEEIYRHPLPVRLWHWLTVACIAGLLFSGICIFNVHPRLYWGEVGNEATQPVVSLDGAGPVSGAGARSVMTVGSARFDLTGIAGVPLDYGPDGKYFMIFNMPESWHFGGLRGWHFALAWVLVAAGFLYAVYLLFSRRFSRALLPTSAQLAPAAIRRDLWDHLRLRRPRGEASRQYSLLQKLAYLALLGVLLPLILLTGLTMSNAITMRFPELYSLFGGRESARTLHALGAALMILFILVHVFQAVVAGLFNQLRSMLTGYYRIDKDLP